MKSCHRCGGRFDQPGQPGYNNLCARCGMPLHCCANCRHYVPRGSLRCLMADAPRVLDPKAVNQCALFEFVDRSAESEEEAAVRFAQKALEADGGPPQNARRRFKELFEGES